MSHVKRSSNIYNHIVDFLDSPIVSGIAIALWVVPVYFLALPYLRLTPSDIAGIQEVAQWVSILNGIFLALILPNAWTKSDNVIREFEREISTITTLFYSILSVSKKARKKFLNEIRQYVEHVGEHYASENKDLGLQQKGNIVLHNIRYLVGELNLRKNADVVVEELFRLTGEIVDSRQTRISLSKQRIPRPFVQIWIVASTASLVPFLGQSFENPIVGVLVMLFVSFVTVYLLITVLDLDDPMSHQINLFLWVDLLELLTKEQSLLEKKT